MEDDFNKLDADTEDEFQDNLEDWAGVHDSEAIGTVGEAVYEEMHDVFKISAVLAPSSTDLQPRSFGGRYIRGRTPRTKQRYRLYYRKVRRLKQKGKTIDFTRAGKVIFTWKP